MNEWTNELGVNGQLHKKRRTNALLQPVMHSWCNIQEEKKRRRQPKSSLPVCLRRIRKARKKSDYIRFSIYTAQWLAGNIKTNCAGHWTMHHGRREFNVRPRIRICGILLISWQATKAGTWNHQLQEQRLNGWLTDWTTLIIMALHWCMLQLQFLSLLRLRVDIEMSSSSLAICLMSCHDWILVRNILKFNGNNVAAC